MTLRGPIHRSILALDIERSTTRPNLIKFELRRLMYRLLGDAMAAAGIGEGHCEPLADRGDGVLALIHPVDDVPRSRLLHPMMPTLARLLAEYNEGLDPAERIARCMRLRAVVHAGDVLQDDHGSFGMELDAAFRLLEAPTVKASLRATSAPLVVVVSGQIYESVVLHGHAGICPQAFRQAVRVRVCGRSRVGWVHFPVYEEPPDVAA